MVMVAPQRSAVVLDIKKKPEEWARYGRRNGWLVTRDPRNLMRAPRVVLWVDQRWLDDRKGWREHTPPGLYWTLTLEALFRRGQTLIVWEDAHRTLPVYNCHPQARAIFTDGRALGLPSIVLSQAPSWLDPFVVRSAEHFIAGRTVIQRDLRRIQEDRGVDPTILTELHGREDPGWAAYHRDGADMWALLSPEENVIDGPRTMVRETPSSPEGAPTLGPSPAAGPQGNPGEVNGPPLAGDGDSVRVVRRERW